ncbi:asialoglycoprotein receptor 2-like [Styela clava]
MATVLLYILLLFFGIGICQIEIRSSISSKSQCSSEKDECISLSFNSVQDLKNKLEDKNFQDRLAEQIKRQLLNEAEKPTSPEENVGQLLFINKSMTYKQSKEYCHNMSRNLVSGYIRNKTVLNFTKIGDAHSLWIGLDELNGFWRWADGVNSTANNTNWGTNQPENNNEKCAVVFPKNNWTIHDYPSDNPPHNFSFICEKKITDQC